MRYYIIVITLAKIAMKPLSVDDDVKKKTTHSQNLLVGFYTLGSDLAKVLKYTYDWISNFVLRNFS